MGEPKRSPFDRHAIVSDVSVEGFHSWLLKRRYDDGGWTSTFWCRITAADGLLRVDGDFNPTVFAYGPTDPERCVRWMGSHRQLDSYVMEKAANGTGGKRVVDYHTDLAFEDLRQVIADTEKQDPDDSFLAAMRVGLEVLCTHDGLIGVHEIVTAIYDEAGCYDILEAIGDIGQRPSAGVVFALQALNRLVGLLDHAEVPRG
jgi:hypothetical protein